MLHRAIFGLALLISSPLAAAEIQPVKDCATCPEMVIVGPATFVMGRDGGEPERYEGPPRTVVLPRRFAVARTETSVADFARFVAATGYQPAAGCALWDGTRGSYDLTANWQHSKLPGDPQPTWPVVCVSWYDAKAYTAWLSKLSGRPYRLLSEAEWEYVASEGTGKQYPWGDDPDGGCRVANMYDQSALRAGLNRAVTPARCDDGFPFVAPVGSLSPNRFGVYDILGNVWEWVEDCYVMPYPADAGLDGRPVITTPECSRHVNRGGSWTSDAARHRVTFRGRDPGYLHSQAFGFRVARDY